MRPTPARASGEPCPHGAAAEPHLTAEEREGTGEREQGRGLPHPVGAQEGDDLAGPDLEVEVAHHRLAVVAGGKSLGHEDRRRGAHVPAPAGTGVEPR